MAYIKICCVFSLLFALSTTAIATGSRSANEISVLGGQGSAVTIYCSIPGGVDASSIEWSHQEHRIIVNGSKYRTGSNRLQISNIISQDEGTYQCLFHTQHGGHQRLNAACLYVVGKASFASCSETPQFTCSQPDEIHVTAGQTIMFDTRITYNGSGSSNRNQTTRLLQLFKGRVSGSTLQYVCTNTDKLCQPKGRIGVVQGTDHKFDLKLTLDNAALNNTGVYIARVEVISPDTGAASFLTKIFQVNVEPLPVKIQASGAAVAGAKYSLSCQITSETVPTMVWLQSAPLTTGNGITITGTVRSGNTSTLTLTFNPLQAKHRGNYTCRGVLQKDMSELTVMNNSYVNVEYVKVVNVRASVHNATAVSLSWDLRSSGLNVSHFTIYHRAVLNDTITNEYTTNHSKNFNHAIVQIHDSTPQEQHQFQISVTILVDGYTLYEVERSTLTDASTVTFDETLFQVKVGPIQTCSEWMMYPRKTTRVEKDIREAVANAVSNKCNCSFAQSFIRPGKFSCRSTVNQVVYRSTVIGTNNNNSSMIVGFIEEWVRSSTATILHDPFILDVDPSCDVHISSMLEPECSPPSTTISNHTLITTDEETIQCVNSCLQKKGRTSDCTL